MKKKRITRSQTKRENFTPPKRPTLDEIRAELARRDTVSRYLRAFRITVFALVFVICVSVIVAVIWIPVLKVTGKSMTPTLCDGDVVIVRKTDKFKTGDMIAFYYNNKILIKRAIAGTGDNVYIDSSGNVYVNDKKIDEPYAKDKGEGKCDIEFPYQVPEKSWFVLGDHRSASIDSRADEIGCIKQEDVIGKVSLRLFPLKRISFLNK